MSNHKPQVQTGTTVTVPMAITVVVALVVLTILLFSTSVHLFTHGKEAGDLLYTLAGFVTLGLAFVPAKFLFEVVYEAVERANKE